MRFLKQNLFLCNISSHKECRNTIFVPYQKCSRRTSVAPCDMRAERLLVEIQLTYSYFPHKTQKAINWISAHSYFHTSFNNGILWRCHIVELSKYRTRACKQIKKTKKAYTNRFCYLFLSLATQFAMKIVKKTNERESENFTTYKLVHNVCLALRKTLLFWKCFISKLYVTDK